MAGPSQTLDKKIALSGVGVHGGKTARVLLKPSESGRIVFRRVDLQGREIPLDSTKAEARNCTVLVSGEAAVRTVEHLLAVLYVLGIDSLDIDMNGDEVPVFDGSAAPILMAVREAGLRPLPASRRALRVTQALLVEDGHSSVKFVPHKGFRVTYAIDFPHPLIGKQEMGLDVNPDDFAREVAPARTFGFLKDVEDLHRRGLALGGSLENAVVLDEEKVVNPPLRFPDEFVRHKVLDLIGDLALLGSPLLGHCTAVKAGHALHIRAVQALLGNPSFWTYA